MTHEQLYGYDDFYVLDAEFDTIASANSTALSDYLPDECESLEYASIL